MLKLSPSNVCRTFSRFVHGIAYQRWTEHSINLRVNELQSKFSFFSLDSSSSSSSCSFSFELNTLFKAVISSKPSHSAVKAIYNTLRSHRSISSAQRLECLDYFCRGGHVEQFIEAWNHWIEDENVASLPIDAWNLMLSLNIPSRGVAAFAFAILADSSSGRAFLSSTAASGPAVSDQLAETPFALQPQNFSASVGPWLSLMFKLGVSVDQETLRLLILDLSLLGNEALARMLLKQILDLPRPSIISSSSSVTTSLFIPLLSRYASTGQPDSAFELFEIMNAASLRPDSTCWKFYCMSLLQIGHIDTAISQIRFMMSQNIPRDVNFYSDLLSVISSRARVPNTTMTVSASDSIIALTKIMHEDGISDDSIISHHFSIALQHESFDSDETKSTKIKSFMSVLSSKNSDSSWFRFGIEAAIADHDVQRALSLLLAARSQGILVDRRSEIMILRGMLNELDWNRAISFISSSDIFSSVAAVKSLYWLLFKVAIKTQRLCSARIILQSIASSEEMILSFTSDLSHHISDLLVSNAQNRQFLQAFSVQFSSKSPALPLDRDAEALISLLNHKATASRRFNSLIYIVLCHKLNLDSAILLDSWRAFLLHESIELPQACCIQLLSLLCNHALQDNVDQSFLQKFLDISIDSNVPFTLSQLSTLIIALRKRATRPGFNKQFHAILESLQGLLDNELRNTNFRTCESSNVLNQYLAGLCALQRVDLALEQLIELIKSKSRIIDSTSVCTVLNALSRHTFGVLEPARFSKILAISDVHFEQKLSEPMSVKSMKSTFAKVQVLLKIVSASFPEIATDSRTVAASLPFLSQPPYFNMSAIQNMLARIPVNRNDAASSITINQHIVRAMVFCESSNSDIIQFIKKMSTSKSFPTEATFCVWAVALVRKNQVTAALRIPSILVSQFSKVSTGQLFRSIFNAISIRASISSKTNEIRFDVPSVNELDQIFEQMTQIHQMDSRSIPWMEWFQLLSHVQESPNLIVKSLSLAFSSFEVKDSGIFVDWNRLPWVPFAWSCIETAASQNHRSLEIVLEFLVIRKIRAPFTSFSRFCRKYPSSEFLSQYAKQVQYDPVALRSIQIQL
jgi:hypothetical protein